VCTLNQVIVFSVSIGNARVFVEAKSIETFGPQCVSINTEPFVRYKCLICFVRPLCGRYGAKNQTLVVPAECLRQRDSK